MEKITNMMSVFDNGESWPQGALVFPEIFARGATKMVLKRWQYKGKDFELPMVGENLFSVLELLPDETGILAMKHYDVPEAYILNGDATVRFVLKPILNARGFTSDRLALIKKSDEEDAERLFRKPIPRESQAMFHNKTDRNDVLEMFGDDGYGDCYYRYDSTTGELLSTETHARRS
jgi:hypothetical protein